MTFQTGDGASLPSPLRIGISATTLGGATHDRKQSLRAVIDPPADAPNITITGSNAVQISEVARVNNVITFKVVGVNKSSQKGDASIKAVNSSGGALATHQVSVVAPSRVAKNHDLTGGGVVIANQALNATTSPAITNVPATSVQLLTIYVRFLTITVKDQFGDSVGDLYAGAEVTEQDSSGTWHPINQSLTSSSTYSDPVGAFLGVTVVASGSPQALNWPNAAKLPWVSGCPNSTQNIAVRVDGFDLNPAIVNRKVEICGNGSSTTSPPVTIKITWP